MNIGIDIDDTINNLSEKLLEYAEKYNKENLINHEIQNDKWNFEEAFGWSEYQINDFYSKYIETCLKEVTAKEGAAEYISKLKKEGNKIIIITARNIEECGENVYSISRDWLKENDIETDKIEIGCLQKVGKCKENNIDIFIDDNISHCKSVKEELGIPVLLFNSIYNKQEKELKRVYSWKEAYEQIKLHEQNN